MNNNNLVRFLLTFFLGWIGSLIINHTSLKPEGYTSRTGCYILLTIVTFGIYGLVASIHMLQHSKIRYNSHQTFFLLDT